MKKIQRNQEEMCRENKQVQMLYTKENVCPSSLALCLANSVLTVRAGLLQLQPCLGLKRGVPFF